MASRFSSTTTSSHAVPGGGCPSPPAPATSSRQQARIRARYPRTPASELRLLPSTRANPEGRQGLSTTTLRDWHRRWLGDLPTVTVATESTVGGRAVAVLLPYDMATVNVYAYRHSYAQWHADAGVAVDVLRELMDHRRMDTTQRYYNVGESRRREAIDRVAHVLSKPKWRRPGRYGG